MGTYQCDSASDVRWRGHVIIIFNVALGFFNGIGIFLGVQTPATNTSMKSQMKNLVMLLVDAAHVKYYSSLQIGEVS